MKEYSLDNRRGFLHAGAAVAVGAITGELLVPFSVKVVDDTVSKATHRPTGNAYFNQRIEDACSGSANPQVCEQAYKPSIADKVLGTAVTPASEEIIFRAIPSYLVSEAEHSLDPFDDALLGTGGVGLSRGEILTGVGSSVVFGAVHNITDKGVNLKIIPASQTFSGMIYWYLQRKLGIFANFIAHATYNFKALSQY